MAVHKIRKGLDLPIRGAPIQVIRDRTSATRVGVVADDYPGLRPRMAIEEGQTVKRGQVLFEDRKRPGVRFTAPGAGRIIGIFRGARRVLQSVVIDLSDAERAGESLDGERVAFETWTGKPAAELGRDEVRDLLVESGQWTAFRTRPFSKVPLPEDAPAAIFVTAIDTNPLAPLPDVVIERRREDFNRGLELVASLTEGTTYLCTYPHSGIAQGVPTTVSVEEFVGPHPAGNAGTHIHILEPVSRQREVWHIGYQDVIAIGALFATGQLDLGRVIALAGPPVSDPRLVEARVGVSLEDVVGDQFDGQEVRFISGSVLSGKKAQGHIFAFLGRYDVQISVIREDRDRVLLGWLTPGLNAFSALPIYLSRLFREKLFDFTTNTQGSPRAMVPIGLYERVMPLDILPTFLLRSLVVGDIERAEKLGCLELDEEDLALCSFVCPGKTDYGPILRRNLELIEKEG